MTPEISLVIPVCNEAESLPALVVEIEAATRTLGKTVEILFVDDGSTDGSWAFIQQQSQLNPLRRGIRFRRNFGKSAALDAGFRAARGDIVFTLDADLQDDPAEIPRFVEALNAFDVVSGWKKIRHDPWHKVMPSRVFNAMVSSVTGVRLHDHNCGFKAYRAAVVREVRMYGEMHRFVPVLAAARGYRVGELVIHHRPRQFGHSHYGVRRFIKGFLDLFTVRFLTSFGYRPQHVFGSLAIVLWLLAGFGTVLASGLLALSVAQTFAFLVAIASGVALTLGGVSFIGGLIAELVVSRLPQVEGQSSIAETTP